MTSAEEERLGSAIGPSSSLIACFKIARYLMSCEWDLDLHIPRLDRAKYGGQDTVLT